MEEHPLLAPLTEIMRRDVEFDEQQLKKRRERLAQRRKKLAQLDEGSREYKRLQTELELETAQLQTDYQQIQQLIFERESDIQHKILADVSEEIDRYCRAQGIGLLLRRSPDEVDEDDPDQIFVCLQRTVLYDAGLDVTDEILAAIQVRYAEGQPER